jgi:hypothetical protein
MSTSPSHPPPSRSRSQPRAGEAGQARSRSRSRQSEASITRNASVGRPGPEFIYFKEYPGVYTGLIQDVKDILQHSQNSKSQEVYNKFFGTAPLEKFEPVLYVSRNDELRIMSQIQTELANADQGRIDRNEYLFANLIKVRLTANGAIPSWRSDAKVILTTNDYKKELPALNQDTTYGKTRMTQRKNQKKIEEQKKQDQFEAAVQQSFDSARVSNEHFRGDIAAMSDNQARDLRRFIVHSMTEGVQQVAIKKRGRPPKIDDSDLPAEAAARQSKAEINKKYQEKLKAKKIAEKQAEAAAAAAAAAAPAAQPQGNGKSNKTRFAPLRF